jgi:hypothetical protein
MMRDRHGDDRSRSGTGDGHQPSQRALQAIAAAAERSRQQGEHPAPAASFSETEPLRAHTLRLVRTPSSTRDASVRPSLAAMARTVRRPPPGPDPGAFTDRRRRLLIGAVLVAAVVLVGISAALAVSLATRGGTPRAPSTGASTATTAVSSPTHHRVAAPTPAASTPSTTGPPAAGSATSDPVLAALDPSSGVAGQVVTITGSNFLSADGVIQASFGGQLAPIDCPSQDTCTVTVPTPPAGSPAPVPVTVTTSTGTSNPLTFTYG